MQGLIRNDSPIGLCPSDRLHEHVHVPFRSESVIEEVVSRNAYDRHCDATVGGEAGAFLPCQTHVKRQ